MSNTNPSNIMKRYRLDDRKRVLLDLEADIIGAVGESVDAVGIVLITGTGIEREDFSEC